LHALESSRTDLTQGHCAHLEQVLNRLPLGVIDDDVRWGLTFLILCLWVGIALTQETMDHLVIHTRPTASPMERPLACPVLLKHTNTRFIEISQG
jgi:hypothetical protein